MSQGPLTGRVALVTGANHGIGAATAVALAELGADVAVNYLRFVPAEAQSDAYNRQRQQTGEEVVSSLEALGARSHGIEADLSDPDREARRGDES